LLTHLITQRNATQAHVTHIWEVNNKKANRTLQLISLYTAVRDAVTDGMADNGLHNHSELETPI